MKSILLCASFVLALASSGCSRGMVPPDPVYTSTRHITCLAVAPDGALWVGTTGGVLRRDRDGSWRKFTRREGLPAHEMRRFTIEAGAVIALFPREAATWHDGRWSAVAPPPSNGTERQIPTQTCAAVWRGQHCIATVTGLRIQAGDGWHTIPLPPSLGTHISTLLPRDDDRKTLWAALYGDGLWSFDGTQWNRLEIGLPAEAREITALAKDGPTVWLGTRRAGVWEYDGSRWTQHLQPDEPFDHDVQSLFTYRGDLYVSTLEDGLIVRTAEGWRREGVPTLSSDAPRQMVEFGGRLYVRHGNGKVDTFDGRQWTRDVCAALPHKEVTALAADGSLLLAAQWGGWSEFDGRTWTHHLAQHEMQGVPTTAIFPEGDTLWIGTQGRGVAEIQRATGRLRWHDARDGLSDDWVTAIANAGGALQIGTFVGGLDRWDRARWHPVDALDALHSENVTALEPDGAGGLFVATRTGLWRESSDGALQSLQKQFPLIGGEVQALCLGKDGLWVGTRTGLYFVSTTGLTVQVVRRGGAQVAFGRSPEAAS